jgi:3-deoxy-D-manno-octulosonic-acid transferase
MSLVRDVIYILFALLTAPVWLVRMMRTGKLRTDWKQRFGIGEGVFGHDEAQNPAAPRVLIHAVSVGEVNAARRLVCELSQAPEHPRIIIAATTDTGFARANDLFAANHAVVRYPFDASFAVRRFLNRTRPDVVVLMELELWPNFVAACRRRGT